MFTELTEPAAARALTVTAPAIGSWRWVTSNASPCSRALMRGRSQTDTETLAIDPPLGTGTTLPIGMKSSSETRRGLEQGAMIRAVCPQRLNCLARCSTWPLTPPGRRGRKVR